jgi:hypothetical protein
MLVATCRTECGRFAALDGAAWLAYTEVGPYVRRPGRAARAAACLNGLQGGRVLGRPVAPVGVASDLAAVEQVLQGGARLTMPKASPISCGVYGMPALSR